MLTEFIKLQAQYIVMCVELLNLNRKHGASFACVSSQRESDESSNEGEEKLGEAGAKKVLEEEKRKEKRREDQDKNGEEAQRGGEV